MCDLFRLIFGLIIDLFRSRAALEAEVLVLKQQIIVLRRDKPNRMSFLAVDRFILGWVFRLFPKTRDALAIVRPDTVVRWHRGLRRNCCREYSDCRSSILRRSWRRHKIRTSWRAARALASDLPTKAPSAKLQTSLVTEYENIRAAMPPGDPRTRRMEVVVSKMRTTNLGPRR
jgi:hypothetical protein